MKYQALRLMSLKICNSSFLWGIRQNVSIKLVFKYLNKDLKAQPQQPSLETLAIIISQSTSSHSWQSSCQYFCFHTVKEKSTLQILSTVLPHLHSFLLTLFGIQFNSQHSAATILLIVRFERKISIYQYTCIDILFKKNLYVICYAQIYNAGVFTTQSGYHLYVVVGTQMFSCLLILFPFVTVLQSSCLSLPAGAQIKRL